MIRMGMSAWMYLLILALLGSPGGWTKAVVAFCLFLICC